MLCYEMPRQYAHVFKVIKICVLLANQGNSLTEPKPSKLDPYKEQIAVWLEEAPYSALRILEKIKERGFEGEYSIVKHFVRGKKEQLEEKATVLLSPFLSLLLPNFPHFN